MAKKNPTTTSNEWGRQTPNGEIDWYPEVASGKLGWTTAAGRAKVQLDYDNELANLGMKPGDSTQLKFFTRTRYIAYTEPVQIVDGDTEDFTGEPDQPQALTQLQQWLEQSVDPPTQAVTIVPAVPVVPEHTLVQDTDVAAAKATLPADEGGPVMDHDPDHTPAPAPTIVINNISGPVPPATHEPIPPQQNPGAWPPATNA